MKNSAKFICVSLALVLLLQGCGKKDNDVKSEPESTLPKTSQSTDTEIQNEEQTKVVIRKSAVSSYSSTANSESSQKTSSSQTNVTVNTAPIEKAENGLTRKDGILIVNKTYSIPADYNPGVNADAQNAFNTMAAAAKKEGISLYVVSGFRSYETQDGIYNNYVAKDGKALADRYSARPGHSEHQTGLAFDVNSLSQSFENTPEGKWLAENCYKYGFIIRFPKGKESITGYMYEPWHVRYIENGKAEEIYKSGKTLEEYLGITSVYAD